MILINKRDKERENLYVSELCDFQEAWSSLCKQKQTFLRHGDFTNTMRRLHTGRQLVDTLAIVKMVNDLSG